MKIVLTVTVTGGLLARADVEALASALVADLTRTLEPGVQFAGNDASGTRREWYVPETLIESEVLP